MNLSDPIAALEIGTTRTLLAIAEPAGPGRIKIAAYSAIPSSGVRKSQIIDVSQATYSVAAVLKSLVQEHGYSVGHAALAVSGPHIRTKRMTSQWQISDNIVQEEDINEVYGRSYDTGLDRSEREELEIREAGYGLDDVEGIISPRGMSGRLLKLHTLCIHGSKPRIMDARNAAAAAKLEISDSVFAGTCAAEAVLTPQDRRDGALVIDLGGGSTAFTAWADGYMVSADVIGIGGDHVTNDIRLAFSLTQSQADDLKIKSSSAVIDESDASSRITLPASIAALKASTISRRALNTVVNARLQELFTIIRARMDEENLLHRLNAGIILTGGGAAQSNIIRLAASVFGRGVRIGTLNPEIEGLESDGRSASFATIAGLLLSMQQNAAPRGLFDSVKSMFGGIFRK